MKILIVEDDELQRKLLQAQLGQKGFAIIAVEDGAEAIRVLSEYDFSLIVSDVNMPGIDGFELAKIVKGSDNRKHIPFLLYSSKTPPSDYDLEMAKRFGVDKYVMKAGTQGIVNEILEFLKP